MISEMTNRSGRNVPAMQQHSGCLNLMIEGDKPHHFIRSSAPASDQSEGTRSGLRQIKTRKSDLLIGVVGRQFKQSSGPPMASVCFKCFVLYSNILDCFDDV